MYMSADLTYIYNFGTLESKSKLRPVHLPNINIEHGKCQDQFNKKEQDSLITITSMAAILPSNLTNSVK
jgi:hypothetical protein